MARSRVSSFRVLGLGFRGQNLGFGCGGSKGLGLERCLRVKAKALGLTA